MFNAYPGRNATCPLSSCSNKNAGPCGRFNCIFTVACKGPVCVEVLTRFYGRFFAEVVSCDVMLGLRRMSKVVLLTSWSRKFPFGEMHACVFSRSLVEVY